MTENIVDVKEKRRYFKILEKKFTHLMDRSLPANITARQTLGMHNSNVTSPTVCNRLSEAGLRTRRPVVGAILKQRHRAARLR